MITRRKCRIPTVMHQPSEHQDLVNMPASIHARLAYKYIVKVYLMIAMLCCFSGFPEATAQNIINKDRYVEITMQDFTVTVKGKVVEVDRVYEYDPFTQEYIPIKYIVQFLGIPYAHPPIGDRRFKPPQAHKGWPSTFPGNWQTMYGVEYPGTKFMPSCPQDVAPIHKELITTLSEDCLYLNIYTPFYQPSQSFYPKYPVMVHIHGGSFVGGGSIAYPGEKFAEKDVVLVTFNYRLGPLGFMTLGVAEAPGNYGLLDQVEVLRWVQSHIHRFHGDPNKVTIFGESAGGASVGLHMLLPKSEGLFHGAIASSGAEVAEWASYWNIEQAVNHTRMLAKQVGCFWTDTASILNCLRSRDALNLGRIQVNPDYGLRPAWAPVVDGYFRSDADAVLRDPPKRLLETRSIRTRVPYMTGTNRDEASMMFYTQTYNPDHGQNSLFPTGIKPIFTFEQTIPPVSREEYDKYIYNFTLRQNYTRDFETRNMIFRSLAFEYMNWTDPTNRTLMRQSLIDMYTDTLFKAPAELSSKLHAPLDELSTTPTNLVFVYSFEYIPRFNTFPNWTGVPHGKELPYVWGFPWLPNSYPNGAQMYGINFTDADRNMSEFMQRMWVNFANYSKPIFQIRDFPRIFENTTWRPYNMDEQFYLKINITTELKRNFVPHKAAYWNEYLPTLADLRLPPRRAWWLQQSAQKYQTATWSLVGVALVLFLLVIILTCMFCWRRTDPKRRRKEMVAVYS